MNSGYVGLDRGIQDRRQRLTRLLLKGMGTVDRTYRQSRTVEKHDFARLCSALVETDGNHHRFRQHDSFNRCVVMPSGKLPRDVDRVAYRRQSASRVVAGLANTGQSCMQMDDEIG